MEQGVKSFGALIKRAEDDTAFRTRLLEKPGIALREQGIEVPEGVKIAVVENSDTRLHLVLPVKPSPELADEELERVAGGIDPFFAGAAAIVAIGILWIAATTAGGAFVATKGFTENPFKR
jgi:hypothetical protein